MANEFNNFGVKKGLAYRHDFGSDIARKMQLRQYQDQKKLEREQEAQYFAEKMKTPVTFTKYGTKRMQAKMEEIRGSVSDFRTNNPGWEEDIDKQMELQGILDGALNNNIMQEELDVKRHHEMMLADYHNSSDVHMKESMARYDAYSNTEFLEGDDPSVSQTETFRYQTEPKWTGFDVVEKYTANVPWEQEDAVIDGNFLKSKSSMSEKWYLNTYNSIMSNSQDSRAMDKAHKEWLGSGAFKKNPVGVNLQDFTIERLKQQKGLSEQLRGETAQHKTNVSFDATVSTPLRYKNLTRNIVTQGETTLTDEALKFTVFNEAKNDIPITGSGALFADVEKMEFSNKPTDKEMNDTYSFQAFLGNEGLDKSINNTMQAVSAVSAVYIPQMDMAYGKVLIEIPRPEDLSAIEKLNGKGFYDHKAKQNPQGISLGISDSQDLINTKDEVKFMRGYVYVPMNMTDPDNIVSYEMDFKGSGQKVRQAAFSKGPGQAQNFTEWMQELDKLYNDPKYIDQLNKARFLELGFDPDNPSDGVRTKKQKEIDATLDQGIDDLLQQMQEDSAK